MHSSLPVEEKPYSNYKCTRSTCLYRPVWVGLLYLFGSSCVPTLMIVGGNLWPNASALVCRQECFCNHFLYSAPIKNRLHLQMYDIRLSSLCSHGEITDVITYHCIYTTDCARRFFGKVRDSDMAAFSM
jgi:hypothetical protein